LSYHRAPALRPVALILVAVLVAVTTPAAAMRIVTYNVLNFPGTTGTARQDDFRTVLYEVDPDVIVVQEMLSLAGANQFLNNVLNYGGTGEYAAAPFVDGYDTDNACYYRVSAVEFVSNQQIGTALRDISEYVLKPVGYSSSDAEFAIYSLHLKAGSTSSDLAKRLAETTILRDHLNALPTGSHFIVAGDYNIRASTEAAYQELVESQADNDGRSKDPINRPGTWHDNYSFADIHTQSPRTTQFGGGATGGMDDRFDLLLISYACDDGSAFDFIPGTHVAYGNDGLHMNQAINYGTNYAVSAEVADALHEAADHLPVFADFQIPAKISAPALLAFGTVIVGATAEENLPVGNVAVSPADELDYSLAAPAGFAAPGGSFSAAADASNDHVVSMDTGTVGYRSGSLLVSSNDLDDPSWAVALSGTVVGHANPSLADGVIALLDTIDFGTHEYGAFPYGPFSVYNDGYSALQALLEVYDAEIVGGDARFSFVDGFTVEQAGMDPAEYTLAFDDDGAVENVTYEATLTLSTRDESGLRGGVDLPDLTVHLAATVEGGTSVPDAILALALAPALPNPFSEGTSLRLALPQATDVIVTVYDVRGRLVRTLSDGGLPGGTHEIVWDGRDSRGADVGSGIYFCRAEVGSWTESRKLVLLR